MTHTHLHTYVYVALTNTLKDPLNVSGKYFTAVHVYNGRYLLDILLLQHHPGFMSKNEKRGIKTQKNRI